MPPETDALSASLRELQLSFNDPSSNPQHAAHEIAESALPREDRLLQELEQVRSVNASITAVLDAITVAESNLEKVVTTTRNVDSLLNLWMRILSQTEHTQRIIFDPKWEGATKDEQLHQVRLAAMAAQQAQAKAQAERRAQEMAAAAEKQKQADEKKQKRDATLQKRIYGNKLGNGKPSALRTNSSAMPMASNSWSAATTRQTGQPSITSKTTGNSAVPTRQRSVLRSANSNASGSRMNLSRTAGSRTSNSTS
ncbi:DASH complex subunit Duo1-domain-containing protein [Lipomyces kononenkoae]|uniref:DASH complex subunit Duo1-domain-containing protein n=1 Tax=Lipomyces kononenkoae TaxID=34357 RepID=A0ACC3SU34_LIPKO